TEQISNVIQPGLDVGILTARDRNDRAVQIFIWDLGKPLKRVAGSYLWIHERDLGKIRCP
ncbi:MAG: hypothetical protein OXI83_03285, partial [Gemmatimonadota bacterium]|nr:hypothetical protein [Gemmatimonadota bacterium]